MSHEVNMVWQEGMSFEAEVNNHKFIIDADESVGGQDQGPRPKPLMLAALAGCTGMDVISILKKMRVEPTYFNVKVSGELSEDHPKTYTSMHIIFEFKGEDLQMDKLEKAINLSETKYCGVSALYKKVIPVTSEIRILD